MMNFPTIAQLSGGSGESEWTLTFDGGFAGWAFLGLLVLSALTVYSYLRLPPSVPAWRKYLMMALRIAVFAVLFILLAKPVLHLTVNEPVRQGLAVLVDASQSMEVKDRRDRPEDLARAAIAAGELAPAGGVDRSPPANAKEALGNISRRDLLQKLAANARLDLWPALNDQADLLFYRFGRTATPMPYDGQDGFSRQRAVEIFSAIPADEPATGIGDALQQVLLEDRDRPLGALLVITDGQSNSGASPLEAAQMAGEQGIPVYVYGVGVTSPPDVIVEEIDVQKLAFVDERLAVNAKVRAQGLKDRSVSIMLRVDGLDRDEQTLEISGDGQQTVTLYFVPEQVGEARIEVVAQPQPEEISTDNNTATARLRVTDEKFNVLLIEQEPRWDFRYLLAYLQRDRRLEVRCVVIDGEPGLDRGADSVFLPALPDDREEYFKSEVLILGDVSPEDLGYERMQIIRDWVEAGGGIIFLAGPRFDPNSYADTPLEPLLPVVPDPDVPPQVAARRTAEPFKLQLTSLGRSSPYLQMAPDALENEAVWESFPGVKWTAPVLRAKPAAQVLLVDPRPEATNRYGPRPVFVTQGYGAGTSVYLGTGETYRWRSNVGEKYYSILWGQIMQSLALELLEGGSARTQLRADRKEYVVGDKISLTARVYDEGFTPLIAPGVEGTLSLVTTDGDGNVSERQEPLNLSATSEGGFRAELDATAAAEYRFSLNRDPETVLRFEVIEPRLERVQTALNERQMRAAAEISGGRFLREEDLHELPGLIREKSATVSNFKRVQLYHSLWWLVLLVLLASAEWLLRRTSQLK